MCTWVRGAHVTTGAAWVWAQGADPRGQDTLGLHRGDRSRRVDGMTGSVRVAAGREPSSPRTHSSLSDSLLHSGPFHPHSTAFVLRHNGPAVVGPALSAWSGSPEPSRVTSRLFRAVGSRESCAQQTEVKLACWPVLRGTWRRRSQDRP